MLIIKFLFVIPLKDINWELFTKGWWISSHHQVTKEKFDEYSKPMQIHLYENKF